MLQGKPRIEGCKRRIRGVNTVADSLAYVLMCHTKSFGAFF